MTRYFFVFSMYSFGVSFFYFTSNSIQTFMKLLVANVYLSHILVTELLPDIDICKAIQERIPAIKLNCYAKAALKLHNADNPKCTYTHICLFRPVYICVH